MRKLLAIGILFVAAPSWAAIAHVGSAGANGTASVSVTRAAGGTSNLYVVACVDGNNTATLANTTTAFTWNQIKDLRVGDGSHLTSFWAVPSTTASQTITCTCTGATFCGIQLDEFSGTATASVIDVSSGTTATTTQCTTISSMTANGEVGVVNIEDTVTAVGTITGNTALKGGDDLSTDWAEYFIFGAGTGNGLSVNGTFTGSGTTTMACISSAIKAAAAAAGTSGPNKMRRMEVYE